MRIEQVEALAVEMPPVSGHPNRLPFRGVLTLLDVPSDRPPSGSRGKRVVLTRAAAEAALPSLLGMAIGYKPSLDGHDARRKVGVITRVDIRGNRLEVGGHLFARDFPELVNDLRVKQDVGMSFEVSDAYVEQVTAPIWKLTRVTFTGAAILMRDKAAYNDTWIRLEASASGLRTGAGLMNEQHVQELVDHSQRLATVAESLSAAVSRLEAQRDEMGEKIARIVAAVEEQESGLKARIAELESQNQELAGKLAAQEAPGHATARRKTIPATVSALLAKSGVQVEDPADTAALDAALAPLSIEQRVAVKSQLARAGVIG